jgi:mRNA interferase RelE/StbE
MYQIKFTRLAHQHFLRLPLQSQKLCQKSLDKLSIYPHAGEALKGELKNYYKLRFSQYRIIYQLFHQTITIVVFEIRHRKDIYKKFKS